ncbi:MAG TPA: ubiquinol-cytochrome c reductase iron-sulfur subunit [Halobacteriales archaeon]|uniref:ubiquinol-cytochrome c reductase iron-sulfur subunit n=1 Tax=Candidatus Hikarchaeum yamanae TaxID=2675326 RepID=UPI001819665C|nr:ubiquinol-cytochrome c reductase iron-sulfur subunit [Halobacteriales archaeon]|tara:strand:- start:10897 stop:11757 length:861 start_codon:yes stop_codon:yes gene_type:complete
MTSDDKYPKVSGRRRFVKGVVGGAALAGIGTATSGTVNTMTNPSGAGGGVTEYFGIEKLFGPAPRGMPQIPVVIDDDGFLMGLWPKVSEIIEGGRKVTVAQQEIAGVTYSSDWFQYCGVQTYPGVKPLADQDNYFRYANNPPYKWQKEEVSPGAKVHIDDFEDYVTWGNSIGKAGVGKPAFATWRSQDVPPQVQMPVQLIRSTIVDNLISNAQGETKQWLQESCRQGFIAILDKCTHFCCVPGFKSFTDSEKFDGADLIYCQCHQSVYDPFSIIKDRFVALPRTEE